MRKFREKIYGVKRTEDNGSRTDRRIQVQSPLGFGIGCQFGAPPKRGGNGSTLAPRARAVVQPREEEKVPADLRCHIPVADLREETLWDVVRAEDRKNRKELAIISVPSPLSFR